MEIWGVTAYFNPAGYGTKLRNLRLFADRVRSQGLRLCVVELAFAECPFSVTGDVADCLLQVRSDSVMWQKERLLNLAFDRLPADCDRIVWLDGDVLFGNDDWVEQTARLLETHKIVQAFQAAVWLPVDVTTTVGPTEGLKILPGLAWAYPRFPEPNNFIDRPDRFHPGFAWAARREVLNQHGLYDKFILGGGDFIAMLAMYCDSSVLARPNVAIGLSRKQAGELTNWMDRFHETVAGEVSFTPGVVYHLWHGNLADRQYLERYKILRECDFDPASDIALNADGCWQWSTDKPELHARVKSYFPSRREDG